MTDQGHGTITADGTEQTLADLSSQLTYVGLVDLSNMQAGDILELRIYQKVLTAGGLHLAYYQQFFDAPTSGNAVQISLPVPSLWEWKFTLKQTGGTNRAYDWTALSL